MYLMMNVCNFHKKKARRKTATLSDNDLDTFFPDVNSLQIKRIHDAFQNKRLCEYAKQTFLFRLGSYICCESITLSKLGLYNKKIDKTCANMNTFFCKS